MSSQRVTRAGSTLLDAVLALIVLSLLMLPLVGMLQAVNKLWQKYDRGHGSIAARQQVAQEVARILWRAKHAVSVSSREFVFLDSNSKVQRLYQSSDDLMWEHDGVFDTIAENVGRLQFRILASASDGPQLGQLLQVSLDNGGSPAMSNSRSSFNTWIRPDM